jgi:PAS domain S-box-containing protein
LYLVRTAIRHGVLTMVLVLLTAMAGDAQVRRVLLLQSQDRGILALDSFTDDLRQHVEARSAAPVTFSQVIVYPSGYGPLPEPALVEFLKAAYKDREQPDLVVSVGGPAAAFARTHRRTLFPGSPMMFAAADLRFLRGAPLADDETAVAAANDPGSVVDGILQLLPETSTIFMVLGRGEVSRFWRNELEREFQRFRDRITFRWSTDLTHHELLEQVATLPSNSAIFHYSVGSDLEGSAYPEDRTVADIHAVANAPMFAAQSVNLGHGIVGGRLMPIDKISDAAANAMLAILSGRPPGSIRIPAQRPGPPTFDWRELRRWNIGESRLPPGSEIRFREPGIWERFRWFILAGASALIGQTLLITALLVGRRKQRRAEESVRESEGRFRTLADSAPVLIRISDADMRCRDVNRPWLDFTGHSLADALGDDWLSAVHPDDQADYRRAATRALERRDAFRTEYRLRRFDGEYRWMLTSAVPRFTPDGSFAGYIASAIDITELKAARAALSNLSGRLMEAQEQERTRVARELHDDVLQRISFVTIDLARLHDTMPATAADARSAVAATSAALSTLGRDIQGISHRLHSSKLGYLGLTAAAGSFCQELAMRHEMRIAFVHERVPAQLPEGIAISLMRVLQESLSNAVKHAGARECRVTLRGAENALTLEVADDGCGFEIDAALHGHGLGLVSMQERLKLVNGTVAIESSVGAGTTVRATVPLSAHAAMSA